MKDFETKKKELEEIAFDSLGDLIPMDDIQIKRLGGGKIAVIVMRTHGIPSEMFYDEWKHAVEGTEYENDKNVDLYV